jgi:CSLREA domain-containing protein
MSLKRRVLGLACVAAASLAFAPNAGANTIQVTTSADDAFSTPSTCSLREAISVSNNQTASPTNGCTGSSGTDTITFNPSLTGPINLIADANHGPLLIMRGVTITGPGMGQLTINAPSGSRAIKITSGAASVAISGLRIQGGAPSENDQSLGGGIMSDSPALSLTDVKVSGNTVTATGVTASTNTTAAGGGVYSSGALTLDHSVVVGNSAVAQNPLVANGEAVAEGGGIVAGGGTTITYSTVDSNNASATDDHGSTLGNAARAFGAGVQGLSMTVDHSTITANAGTATSPEGGAFVSGAGVKTAASGPDPGVVTIESSTIADNLTTPVGTDALSSIQDGGGLETSGGTMTLRSDTIAFNGPSSGSDTAANLDSNGAGGTWTIKNTIVSNPQGGTSTNCDVAMTSAGFNIDSGSSCALSLATDQLSTNPMVGSLRQNGGPTVTKLLPPNSPAIDKGSSAGMTDATHDQRGFTRTVDSPTIPNASGGDGTDIGSVEARPPAAPTVTGVTPASPATTITTPKVLGGTDGALFEGATSITIYSNSTCSTALMSDTPATFAAPGVQVTVPQNATTDLFAKAVNAYGIPSACSSTLASNGSISYTHDSLGPVITIDSGPTDPTNHTATFTWHGTDLSPPITYMCSLDTGTPSFAPCTSPFTSASLGDGSYTFRVKGTDSLANAGSPTTQAFAVTTSAPTPKKKKCKKAKKRQTAATKTATGSSAAEKCKKKK